MTASNNIERFDELTGRIFAVLYQSFPVPQDFIFPEYLSDLYPDFDPESDSFDEMLEFFSATINWLSEAGYVSFQSMTMDGSVFRAGLTAKGLEVLKATPANLQGKKSIGEGLTEAVKGGFLEQVRSLTAQGLGYGVALVTTATVATLRSS